MQNIENIEMQSRLKVIVVHAMVNWSSSGIVALLDPRSDTLDPRITDLSSVTVGSTLVFAVADIVFKYTRGSIHLVVLG